MWKSGADWYFSVGEDGLRCVRRALEVARDPPVHRILDLPCGHGRVARYLRAAFPEATMAFCDIDRSGVDFCAREFGGVAIYSQPDLTQVDLGSPYDVIWIGSLFTHLDRARTQRWLEFLVNALTPTGVLAATFHGLGGTHILERYQTAGIEKPAWSRIIEECRVTGYGYAPYEADGNFGIAIVQPTEVISIAQAIPGCRIIGYGERAWADNHDVLSLSRVDRFKLWD